MRKNIVVSAVIAVCLLILSLTAFAASVGSLPEKWSAPTNVIITNDAEEDGSGEFVLRVSYSLGEDHSLFAADVNESEKSERYGLNNQTAYETVLQIDWRIDGGAWHYTDLWDKMNEERPGGDLYYNYREFGPYGGERTGEAYFLRLPVQESWSSDGWDAIMSAQGVTDTTANADGYVHLDLTKHLVEARVRLATRVRGEDVNTAYGEENSEHYILSDWSATAAIGKGVGGAERPTSIPKPAVSAFAVAVAKNDGTVADGYPIFTFNLAVPEDISKISSAATALFATLGIRAQVSVNGGEWQDIRIGSGDWAAVTSGSHTGYMPGLTDGDYTTVLGGECKFRARYHWFGGEGAEIFSDWSDALTFGTSEWQSSAWATDELKKADELKLIPDVLAKADLTKSITRAEFAAVCVKTYEALSGTAAIPAVNNPFTDTSDVDVLKAYNIGAVNGMSATTFVPNALLNREQAATMLTRVFKKVSLVGWTLATDSQFKLEYTKPAAFADDAKISDFAKDSVYFMAANEIIKGVDNNNFAPRAVTTAEQAANYASATREQALVIAVRMVQKLGSK